MTYTESKVKEKYIPKSTRLLGGARITICFGIVPDFVRTGRLAVK